MAKKGKKGSKKKGKKGKGGPSPDATYTQWLTYLHEERLAAGKWVNNQQAINDVTLTAEEPGRRWLLKVPEGGPRIVKDVKQYEKVKAMSACLRKVVVYYFAAFNNDVVNDEPLTPQLIELYNNAIEAGKKVEVIYVPLDIKQEQFEEFFETMPWLAIPMGDPAVKALTAKYRVSLPPKVVIIGQDDKLVTEDGVKKILQHPNQFPFSRAVSLNAVEAAQRRPNHYPCMIADAKCKKFEGGTLSKQYETEDDKMSGIKIPGVCNGCGHADIYHIPVHEEEDPKEAKGKGKKGSKKKKK